MSSSELLRSLSSSQEISRISRDSPRRALTSSIPEPADLQPNRPIPEQSIADIVSSRVDAVVRIQCACIKFDWGHPYRHGGQSEASGSGFFYTADGLIITNAHVVVNARRVWISIPSMGERRYDAQVVGICFDSDIAVLRSPTAPVLSFLELGESNEVKIGETVVALGYPYGMKTLKLTMGVISGRAGALLQTDAALNPGNSGGPMLNHKGQVVGINVSILVDSQNIGFSIPVSLFQILQHQLLSTDRVVVAQPTFGAGFQMSSEAIMDFLGVSDQGVLVTATVPGFPLYDAGLRPGDIIHSVDGFLLDNFGTTCVPWSQSRVSATDLIALYTSDDKPQIVYSRDGKKITALLNLEDPENPGQPKLPAIRHMYPAYEPMDFEVIFGLVFMNLTLDHVEIYTEIKDMSQNVLQALLPIRSDCTKQITPRLVVSGIFSGATTEAVFDIGTLISMVNDIPCTNLTELRAALLKPVRGANGKLFFTLKTVSNEFLVVPLLQGLQEEFNLSENYHYQVSSLFPQIVQLLDPQDQLSFAANPQPLSSSGESPSESNPLPSMLSQPPVQQLMAHLMEDPSVMAFASELLANPDVMSQLSQLGLGLMNDAPNEEK